MSDKNKGRTSKKFNAMDVFIVLLLIMVIGVIGTGYKYVTRSTQTSETGTRIEYDIELQGREKHVVDAIHVEDEIRDSIRGNYLGKVINIKVVPATQINSNTVNGTFVKAQIPNKYDIILTLEANGVVTPNSVAAEGVEIRVGQEVFVKGKGYGSQGYIIGVRFEE